MLRWSAKSGLQKADPERQMQKGREPSTYVKTLVCLLPRADSFAYAYSAGPRFRERGE